MKKRIILFILLVFSVVMVVTGLYMNGNIGKDKTLSLPKDAYELTDVKTIKLCIAPEGCLYTGEDMYATITYDFNNEDIQNTLKKINQETDELYQKAISSDMTAPECQAYSSMYEHRYRSNMLYYSYTGDDFISFFIQRMNQDMCVENSEEYKYEFYYYDMNKHKFLTEQEVM